MNILQSYVNNLEFSCCPAEYDVKMGSIGACGYTGICRGKNKIPDSMMFTIRLKDETHHELLQMIHRNLCVDSESLMSIQNTYDEYIESRQKYTECLKNLLKYHQEQCVMIMEKLNSGSATEFKVATPPCVPCNLKYDIDRNKSAIRIHCRKDTQTYKELLEARLLDTNEYDY
jgi:hypothetical protein